MRYTVTIREVIEKDIVVEAETEIEAADKVRELYDKGYVDMGDAFLESTMFECDKVALPY